MEDAVTDSELIRNIRDAEPGSFERFVERFGERIYGFGLRMCGDREDALDVAQETLLQAFVSLKSLKKPGALRAWVYRVAANACLMKRRRGKFEPERELSLEDLMPRKSADEVGAGRKIGAEIPDTRSLPDEDLARSQIAGIVKSAVETLPAHYRIVLVMRDLEQLTTAEVAHALSLPETAVKMRLHRARLMVRRTIEASLATSPGTEQGRAV